MRIAIVGGTGTVGAEAARELERRGHAVRVLSRHAPEHAVDLRDGSGLAAALDGVDVVVNAANGNRKVLVDGTARLLRAAKEAEVRHYVGVSIVGVDRVGIRYYKAKLAQEELIQRSGVPWTIVRATQFHPFVARTFAASAKLGIVPCLKFPMQPVDPREVGRVLAETAEAEPSLAITQFAGPEVLSGVRAGPALAPADRLARGARAPARDPRAALGRADEPGREARQRDLRRVARLDDRRPGRRRRRRPQPRRAAGAMTTLLRVTLACLAFSAAVPGLQATISPSAFYDGFPFGRAWVQMLPPYNEHLIRDVGNYKLAFAILFAWAAWRPSRELVVPLASAWSVAALLHAVYHALHLDGFGAGDAIALIAVLVSVLALPVLAIVFVQRERVPPEA